MKSFNLITFILMIGGLIFITACGGDDPVEPTPDELRLEELAGTSNITWALATGTAVTLEGNDRTDDWQNFELTLTTSKSYNTTSSFEESVWPSAGTWDFTGTEGAGLLIIIRSDQQQINIDNISTSNLTLSFNKVLSRTNQNERVNSIEGEWVFKFVKK